MRKLFQGNSNWKSTSIESKVIGITTIYWFALHLPIMGSSLDKLHDMGFGFFTFLYTLLAPFILAGAYLGWRNYFKKDD